MKAFSKRGSAVLDAPEEAYAPDTPWAEPAAVREPAPAGALLRGSARSFVPAADEEEEAPYIPVRSKWRLRLRQLVRNGLGRSILGGFLVLALAASAFGVYVTRRFLMHDARFVIPSAAEIETQGNSSVPREDLLSVFGADVERNIFKVPLAERRAEIERIPWVEHATVMRLLPDRLRIAIVERTPVAFVRQGTSIGLVDAGGVLLDMPANAAGDPHYSFPVLTGISASDPLSTRAARMAIYRRFVKDLDSSGEKISDSLSEVDISNPEDVKALIPSGSTDIMVHFGDEDFLERYRHFQEHLPEWKQQYPKLASADMRYDREVVLEMSKDTGSAPTPPATVSSVAAPSAPAPAAAPAAQAVPRVVTTAKAPAVKRPAAAPAKATPVAAARPRPSTARPAVTRISTPAPKSSASNEKMFAALAAARKQMENSGQGPR